MTAKIEEHKANLMEFELVRSREWKAFHDEVYTDLDGIFICSCPSPEIAAYFANKHNLTFNWSNPHE